MNDDELRGLIRLAIQKHMTESPTRPIAPELQTTVSLSFGQYHLERARDDTACLIEPAVQCNHCGFCKCHGH